MKVIFVAGAWGSGTTALAGALVKLSTTAFGPRFQTNDPRTTDSYELVPFRDLILSFVDEPALQLRPGCSRELERALAQFAHDLEAEKFGVWPPFRPRRAVLKLPAATLCLRQLIHTFKDISILLMLRPFDEIEASRARRNWDPHFGANGACEVYSTAIHDLIELNVSYLAISYRDLIHNTHETLTRVIEYCDLGDLKGNLPLACLFIQPDNITG